MKARSLVVFSNHYLLHRWSAQSAPFLLFSSDELMSCAANTIGCLDLRCCAFPPCELMRARWSRFPGPNGMACWWECSSFETKPSRLDACENRKIVRWCRMQASSQAFWPLHNTKHLRSFLKHAWKQKENSEVWILDSCAIAVWNNLHIFQCKLYNHTGKIDWLWYWIRVRKMLLWVLYLGGEN